MVVAWVDCAKDGASLAQVWHATHHSRSFQVGLGLAVFGIGVHVVSRWTRER